jgi:uncharacterized protein YgiM (DUF1202 family)
MRQVFKRILTIGIIALLTLTLVGAAALAQPADQARVRFVHAIPEATAIDVYINGALSITDLSFGEESLFVFVPSGEHDVTVNETGTQNQLWQQTATLNPATAVTMIASSTSPLEFQAFQDDLATLELGKARFTALNVIAGGEPIDVLLSNANPVVVQLAYNQVYGTLDLPALAYEFGVVTSGGSLEAPIVPVDFYALTSGISYTMLVYGTADAAQVKLLSAAADAPAGDISYVRVAHGVPGAPEVDVFINNTLFIPRLAFGSATGYFAVPAGSYDVTLRSAGNAEESLAEASLDVPGGVYVTAAAVLSPDGLTIATIGDPVSEIGADAGLVNVANTLADTAIVALTLADGSTAGGDVAAGETTTASVAPASGESSISVTVGDNIIEATLPNDTLYGGVYYSTLIVTGEEPEIITLPAVSIAQSLTSAPGAGAVVVVEAEATEAPAEEVAAPVETEEAAVEVAVEPTVVPLDAATPAAPEPAALLSSEIITNEQLTATAAAGGAVSAQPAPISASPTARVLLDPGANLQLRELPDPAARSLGLAPSGAVFIVNGRSVPVGAPDPAAQLAADTDFEPGQTWLNVTYITPEGGSITAWVIALYVDVRTPSGAIQRLADLPAVPSDRGGSVSSVAEAPPPVAPQTVQQPPQPPADQLAQQPQSAGPTALPRNTIVGQVFLNPGVNLQLRRNPNTQAESLALIPSGAQLIITGRDASSEWLRTEYEGREGWVSALYVVVTLDGRRLAPDSVPLFNSPLTEAQATSTAQSIPPTIAPTATVVLRQAFISAEVVAMTTTPGGSSEGLPILTRTQEVGFIDYSPDLNFAWIQLADGTRGWVPISTIIFP